MRIINAGEALHFFKQLPYAAQIGSLNPQYVWADSKRDEPNLTPIYLLHQEGNSFWLFSAHSIRVPNSDYRALSAPYGYGEPVTNSEDVDFVKRAWEGYKAWAWENHVLCDIVKLHPLMRHPYLGERKFNRWTYTVGHKPFPACLNKIRHADKAKLKVMTAPKEYIHQKFAGEYYESMNKLHADPFYIFNENYFQALSEIDDAVLMVCCTEDEEWRSASLMLAGGTTLESHLTVTNDAGRQVGATNYLVHTAGESLHPASTMYLGGGKTVNENDALAKFKASFNGEKLPFYIGWQIHRPDVYNEMKQGITSDRVLWWLQ